MVFPRWNLNDLVDRGSLEGALARLGGEPLAAQLRAQAEAREALQGALSPEQEALYLGYADAASDAWSLREEAGARLALTLGVGVGAALACFPEEDPDAVIDTAARALAAAMCSPLSCPDAVARAALATLEWAPRRREAA